jgi:hypothetical protein
MASRSARPLGEPPDSRGKVKRPAKLRY